MKMARLIPRLPARGRPAAVAFHDRRGVEVEDRLDDGAWAMLRFGDCRPMAEPS